MKLKKTIYIIGGIILSHLPVGAQNSEGVFATALKECFQPKSGKLEKQTKRICRRHSIKSASTVILIPRLYYKKSVREHKRIAAKDYFEFIDPKSITYHAAIVVATDSLYLLQPSPVKKQRYNVFGANRLEVVNSLLEIIQEIRPEIIFTVCNATHLFFVKGSQVLVFDRDKGKIIEQQEALKKIIDDPLSFRYIPPGG